MKSTATFLSGIFKVLVDIICIYILTQGADGRYIIILPLAAVIANLLYEFVSTKLIVCESFIQTTNQILRNFIDRRKNIYSDVGDFINKIDEFPQNIMYVNKSILDSILELFIVVGIILITPFHYLKYISVIAIILALLSVIVIVLRKKEDGFFTEMNKGRSVFNGNLLSITGNIEGTLGSNAIPFSISLLDQVSQHSEKSKNNYMILTGLQQTIMTRAYLLPVFMVLLVVTRLALPQDQISEIILYSVLISGQVIFLASSVVDAVVSMRFLNDARPELTEGPVESALMINDARKIFIRISETNRLFCENLSIQRGDRILINGPTGAGKTCLVEALLGMKDLVKCDNESSIRVFDKRRRIAYVSQNIPLFGLDKAEGVTLGRKLAHKETDVLKPILERLQSRTKNVSGGERIIVGIERALVAKPDILILDEIDRNLDQAILQDVMNVCKENVDTILYISHLDSDVFNPNKVVTVNNGRVVQTAV